jgi:hypothetical protein
VKLTVAGIVHPGGTTTLASPPPPLDACPASAVGAGPLPPELLLDPPTGPVPLLEPPVTDPVPLSSFSGGVRDAPLDCPAPLEDEPAVAVGIPAVAEPLLPAPTPELLDDPLPPVGLASNPDDDPPPDALPVSVAGGEDEELQALQTPAPTTTSRPTRCEWARRFMGSFSFDDWLTGVSYSEDRLSPRTPSNDAS